MGETDSYGTDTSNENFGPGMPATEGGPTAGNVDPQSGRDRDAGAPAEVLDATHPTQIEASDAAADQATGEGASDANALDTDSDGRPVTDATADNPDADETDDQGAHVYSPGYVSDADDE